MRTPNLIPWIAFLLGTYLAVCLLVFLGQRRMMYFPERLREDTALGQARALGLEAWRSPDGRILGWRARHPSGRTEARLLVFHGNAGSALDRAYPVWAFQAPAVSRALEVFLLEYPGYGCRAGAPGQAAFLAAAQEALAALGGDAPVLVLGESIGSGVAALLAGARPREVRGLILVTPYTTFRDVVRHHYPVIPPFLVRDTYPARDGLAAYGGPVAFLVAGRDEVIPPRLGRALHDGYAGPRRLWIEAQAGHNTLDYSPGRPLWNDLVAFVAGP